MIFEQQRGGSQQQPQMLMMPMRSRALQYVGNGMICKRHAEWSICDWRSEPHDENGDRILLSKNKCEAIAVAVGHGYEGAQQLAQTEQVVGVFFLSGGGIRHRRAKMGMDELPRV